MANLQTQSTSVVSWCRGGSGEGLQTGMRELSGDETVIKPDYDNSCPTL